MNANANQIIHSQIVGIQQDTDGTLYNIWRDEDCNGYYHFRRVAIQKEIPATATVKVIDFRSLGGHAWHYSYHNDTLIVENCTTPHNCYVCCRFPAMPA